MVDTFKIQWTDEANILQAAIVIIDYTKARVEHQSSTNYIQQ